MICCRELCKRFVRETPKLHEFYAVDHVSLRADAGEIVGVLGPNGAGKTTLLRLLVGMLQPDDGTIQISDRDGRLLTDVNERKRHIAYLSNNTKLYERLTPREVLYMLGRIYGIGQRELADRSEQIFEALQMEEFADSRIGRLSTGQTQRASLARCFIHDPDIFVLDEPTLGLDILSSQTIIDMMRRERENGKCVLYSTHYMEEAQYLCDRIIMLDRGRILINAPTKEVLLASGKDNLREAFFSLAGEERDVNEL